MGNATKDHEDWKKKKGYGPILVVAVSLALLLSLYAGGYLGSGTNLPPSLHRDEKEMTNAVASSSSTSLVGSGTAQGGSAASCQKNTGYNCGAVFPPDGNTCDQKGCCCHLDNGTGLKVNTCDNAKGYAYRGCKSCWGKDACFKTNNINAGTSSCHGIKSCEKVSDSTIGNHSCLSGLACQSVQNSIIHVGSCHCDDGHCCYGVQNATIGKGSCNTGSSNGQYAYSCDYVVNVKIGNNSCNGKEVCKKCKHNVPDNACNPGITDDMDITGYCNYC